MEAQDLYRGQTSKLFQNYNPHPRVYEDLSRFLLEECRKQPENARQFLASLHNQPIVLINFDSFCTIARIIKKTVLSLKSEQLQVALSDFLLKHARQYFPYIKHADPKQFKELLELFDGLSVREPEDLSDHRKVAIFLSKNNYSEAFAAKVVDLINNEVLVEKKSQQAKFFKINEFFSPFIVCHIDKLIPQLERLLVRNQTNIQIWQEFILTVKNWKGIDSQILEILAKIKSLYLVHPQVCIKIVVCLASSLSEEKAIKEMTNYLTNLVAGQHNAKRKIIFVKMLQGMINCLKNCGDQKIRNTYAQSLLETIAISLIKFTEMEEFNILVEIIDSVVTLITEPKDDIAKALKLYLKNQNKYILILMGIILSRVYKEEHAKSLPSVKEIFNHFKGQLPTYLKKVEVNWQWLLPVINFLSDCDPQLIDNLNEDLPLFKVSCLSLTIPEMKIGLRLVLKKIQQLKSEEEEIEDNIYVISALLLESVKQKQTWKEFTTKLNGIEKVHLISRGIFPLTLFNCSELKKNTGNQFTSLLSFIRTQLKNEKIQIESCVDFARLAICYEDRKNFLKNSFTVSKQDELQQLLEKFVKSSFFDWQNDEQNRVSAKQMEFVQKISISLLKYNQDYLMRLLESFTKEEYYQKDLLFLVEFEKDILVSLKQTTVQILEWRQGLVEKDIHKIEQVKPKKVYIGAATLQVKMMSEQEVKQQKYREHFMKMVKLFDRIVHHFLFSFNDHELLNTLWHKHMKSILGITCHPEHRHSIMKLVKKSCLFTAWHNRKYKESKIFLRHCEFLGDFFSFRNSGITPSVKIMTHCQNFLRQLLELPFESEQTTFHMLEDQQNQFIMLLINEMSEYLLQNMEFDVNLKKWAIFFYSKCFQKKISFGNQDALFGFMVQNINILSNSEHIQQVLLCLLSKVDSKRCKQLFADILNFVQITKKLILQTVSMLPGQYKPQFEEYIKLKILALESNQEISKLAASSLYTDVQLKTSILTFDMKNFVKKNSKETIEKLCLFIREEITENNAEAIFMMVINAAEILFDEGLDQQGLEMLPYFLQINIDHICQALFKPIFYLLVTKFTSKVEFGTLNKMSLDVGINIIKRYAHNYAEKLLLILEGFINKASGVSNIIFLGVLAPFLEGNKNIQIIEKRITQLFKGHNENDQRAISKCMSDLMSFFKMPLQIVSDIFINIGTMSEDQQVGQSYLFAGLLKGIGYEQSNQYLEKTISNEYVTKTKLQKSGRIHLLHAFVENFGRVVEIKAIKIIEIILGYMADSAEDIRNLARRTGQNLILRMSSFSVKILLPQLLKGLEEEQNWRIKISYIWILGVMANCSAKQLQTSLPIIVPSLSTCLSDAHPTIREKASEAMNLIGETIKNPEISNCVDILIEALENPFQKSAKAIQILLKNSFNHYIDPPSLSMIIPILDYCMRGRISDLKAGACQVMGSIVELIYNAYDLLPYLKIILTGIRIALCDPLPQIRRIASMAIGKIASKIGIKDSEEYFKFVVEIMESPLSNSIQRQGAAQAHAEIICSQTYDYFEQSLYKIFQKLNSVNHSEKQGYILVFLYVPSIKTQQFQGFIKEVNENMYSFVSDQDQVIRNSAMLVEKVLVTNYCLSHTDLLLDPLCDGAFDNNWKKRNAAIILIGQILNIIKSHMYNTRTNDLSYAYYRGLMAVYIMKDDELEMTRFTAIQVWNTYIENTPKTIKTGISQLVKMWTKWTHAASGVVFKNIVAFSTKYGQNYFTEILDFLPSYLSESQHQVGVFEVLAQFIKRLNKQFLSKPSYRKLICSLFADNLFIISENVRPSLAKCLSIYVDKMQEERFFEELLYPTISKMDQTEQSNSQYTYNLHLVKDLLNTHSNKVVDRVISKVMEVPMSEFKIEVITNNSQKLANYLYSHFKTPATQVLVDEIYHLVDDKSKQNRLSLIIYCLEQVSLKLMPKYKTEFMRMINSHITKNIDAFRQSKQLKDKNILKKFVNMVFFFLNSSSIEEIEDLDIIIGQISPLIFLGDQELAVLGHKIYLLVITDSKSLKTAQYIRQMAVSFQNKLTKQDQNIWEDEEILFDYVSILVKGVAYGKEQVMEQSLQMLEFLIRHTPRKLVEKYILKIVGPVIRISNYPLLQRQKIKIMELLMSIIKQNYKIDAYNNQILSVCLRLLQEFKNSQDVMQVVANTYITLLKSTVLKQQLIMGILAKLKTVGQTLIQSFYYFVEAIVKEEVELPKSLLQKIMEEITAIALQYAEKLSVKAIYYASKTSARVGVLLGKPIERLQNQLKGVAVSYEVILNYLHYAYYKKARIQRMQPIEIFLKESNRDKIFYLLKSLRLCIENDQELNQIFSHEYILGLVPENLTGFEEISEILEDFEPLTKEEPEGEINKA